MSKNIVIQENGVAQTLNTIRRVVTSGMNNGSEDWVPEDECQLGEVSIVGNGDVTAAEKGLYAFSKVYVNVAEDPLAKAVGKDQYGNYKVISRDENGVLVERDLPTRIMVTAPPTKTSYTTGEAINVTGMVVKAFYADDTEYGIVRNSKLTITPSTATSTTITVKWNRDGDKAELSTSFNITIGE